MRAAQDRFWIHVAKGDKHEAERLADLFNKFTSEADVEHSERVRAGEEIVRCSRFY